MNGSDRKSFFLFVTPSGYKKNHDLPGLDGTHQQINDDLTRARNLINMFFLNVPNVSRKPEEFNLNDIKVVVDGE